MPPGMYIGVIFLAGILQIAVQRLCSTPYLIPSPTRERYASCILNRTFIIVRGRRVSDILDKPKPISFRPTGPDSSVLRFASRPERYGGKCEWEPKEVIFSRVRPNA